MEGSCKYFPAISTHLILDQVREKILSFVGNEQPLLVSSGVSILSLVMMASKSRLSKHVSCSLNLSAAVAISAIGLSNLATDRDNHWRVLESGNMLEVLLRALVLDHALAQHHILRLLCGLVSNQDIKEAVVSAGVLRAVQDMGNRDEHASAISLIIFNISCDPILSRRCVQSL